MTKNAANQTTHPDNFMLVTVGLAFRAKAKNDEAPPLGATEIEITLPAAEAADYLNCVLRAARERRLYGLMVAEAHVSGGDWLGLTLKEVLAEERARSEGENHEPRLPGLTIVRRGT